MEPIINPLWLYLMSIVDTLRIFSIIGTIVFGTCSALYIPFAKDVFEVVNPKTLKKLVTVFIIFAVLAIFVPTKNTLIQMLGTSFVTPDNIAAGTEVVKEAFNYIMSALP